MSEQELLKKVGELNNTLEAGFVFGKEEAWERLQTRMEQKKKPVYLRLPVKIAAAAAVLLLIAGATLWNLPQGANATAVVSAPPTAPTEPIETPATPAMTTAPEPITVAVATQARVTPRHIDIAQTPVQAKEPTTNVVRDIVPMDVAAVTIADTAPVLTIKERLALLPVMTANGTEVTKNTQGVVHTDVSTAETIKDMPIFMLNDGQAEVHTMPEKTVRFHTFFGKNMAANRQEDPPNLTLSISLNH